MTALTNDIASKGVLGLRNSFSIFVGFVLFALVFRFAIIITSHISVLPEKKKRLGSCEIITISI